MVVTVARGKITDEQIRRHSAKIIADPRHVDRTRELCTLEDAEGDDVSVEALRAMVTDDSLYLPKFKYYQLAIVAPTDLSYGMARVYKALTSTMISNLQVFREAQEAYEWLGLNEEEIALVELTRQESPPAE